MELLLGIICIIFAVFTLAGMIMDDVDNPGAFFRVISIPPSATILIIIGIAFIVESQEEPKPKAIDVYRDKTELQVNYKVIRNDTIPTDSIVIWK